MTPGDAYRLFAEGFALLSQGAAALADAQVLTVATDTPQRLTLRAASRRSAKSVKVLRRAIAEGELAAARPGREYVVEAAELDRWLATHAAVPRPTKPERAPRVVPSSETSIDELIARELGAGRLRAVKGGKR
jgi:excisionase family DNA binding protein